MRARWTGLVALVAFGVSWAEVLQRSVCPPGMGSGAAMEMTGQAAPSAGDHRPGAAGAHAEQTEKDRPAAPRCPFGPLVAAGTCALAAFLPATPVGPIAPSLEGAILYSPAETEPHSLLGTTLLHPPRV